jgi:hypothetical protein
VSDRRRPASVAASRQSAAGFSGQGRRRSDETPQHLKILSGGQTGVDRAALDFAIEHGLECGGWCPKGRLAEDGVIPRHYRLKETESPDYVERTERNVLDADATIIIARKLPVAGGTLLTHELARRHGKPVLVVCEAHGIRKGLAAVAHFTERHSIHVLNIAGPRESQAPGLEKYVRRLLTAVCKAVS